MKKYDLVSHIVQDTGMSRAQTEMALAVLIEAVSQSLVRGEPVTLIGFGTLSVKMQPARKGRNPRSGESVEVPAKRVAKFSAGTAFREFLNEDIE